MILVIGATGNTGRPLVRLLHGNGVPVRALTRDPAAAGLPDGVEVARGDLDDPASLTSALAGVTDVFLVARVSALVRHTRAVLAAAGPGTRRIVFLSSLSVTADLGDAIGRWNSEAEALIRESGMAWTFLRAGAFMSNALEWADGIRTEGVATTLFGNAPSVPVHPEDIAEVAAVVLAGREHDGVALPVTGSERISPAEQVAVLGEVLGRDLAVREMPPEAVRRAFAWFGSEEEVARTIAVLSSPDVPWASPAPTVADLTGHAPRTFREWAREHASVFT
ncbi:NAD(P)H-binding protein [Kutzneria kofuensis]|uniref:Uncharacterized protein YbjT (DUF2867 family) n=1 Tax=Kutzneria kofuensis TaxID=103725 RepID=A0A7W9KQJ3_9PSEU|nr:NAD(P)H-binding protein [Kutzneria kofuensis]MBB5896785.1 uncharacterized protein YbjT (DUF2867 family) [Kutzneria kofuensis]